MKNQRERITISIRKEILSKIDKKIDGIKLRNRSHAIESMVVETLGIDIISDVIIMAGGEDAIKSIDSIKELLLKLKTIGVEEVIIAVGYLGKKIKDALKKTDYKALEGHIRFKNFNGYKNQGKFTPSLIRWENGRRVYLDIFVKWE